MSSRDCHSVSAVKALPGQYECCNYILQVLSELAMHEPYSFKALVDQVCLQKHRSLLQDEA